MSGGSVFTPASTVSVTSGCISQSIALKDAVAFGNGVVSDVSSTPNAQQITNIVRMTQAQYNALAVKDPDTLYVLT